MTDARVQKVYADQAGAREFLEQAELFAADAEDLLDRLDASRERRNEASYAAGFVPEASLSDAREATSELLQLTRTVLGG